MATAQDPRQQAAAPKSRSKQRSGMVRFTAEQAYKLSELGFFEVRHVELIEGVFYQMTIDPPHAVASMIAPPIIQRHFGEGFSVRSQVPLDLGRHNLPEPDLAVVVGAPRDFSSAHPKSAVLIIEISDSTLRKDRVLKAHLYARAGIADYWILNLNDRQLEIHRNPVPDASRKGRYRYADVTNVDANGHATPLTAPQSRIAVADLLP
jgi:Uma2 family endonuclease